MVQGLAGQLDDYASLKLCLFFYFKYCFINLIHYHRDEDLQQSNYFDYRRQKNYSPHVFLERQILI